MTPTVEALRIEQTGLPGCYELFPQVFRDHRGCFVKTFHEDAFVEAGLVGHFAEEYYSVSHRRVLRGLHFQIPPSDHVKLVYCIAGFVLDVVVDVREGSPTFGQHQTFTLNARRRSLVYIPSGLAHGFYVLSANATLVYKTTSVHSPEHDTGIRWNSAGIEWPDTTPVVSARDQAFPALSEFRTPFRYHEP